MTNHPNRSRKARVSRTGERLVRLAYDLEDVAARLRDAGYDSEANGVRAASSNLGNIGRSLDRMVRP